MSIFPGAFHSFQKGFALLVSILCSLCLLVGLGVKKSHLKLICFVSVSSVLFVPPMHLLVKRGFILLGLPRQFSQVLSILSKGFSLLVSILCSLCFLVGLGVKQISS